MFVGGAECGGWEGLGKIAEVSSRCGRIEQARNSLLEVELKGEARDEVSGRKSRDDLGA